MTHRWCVVCLLTAMATAASPVNEAAAQEPLAAGTNRDSERTNMLGTVRDSFNLLLIEHAWRIGLQEKTRRELGGNFWRDYRRSVRIPRQWEDTDAWWVNYIGHPVHGAAAGHIWLNHKPGVPTEISLDRKYWMSRMSAFAWVAGYSLQFEIGPLSEASIGNVGMRSETTGWVDHVVTPIGAIGFMIAEDALDRFVVKWAEQKIKNPIVRIPIRFAANPARTVSNTASGRAPWYRAGRPLDWK